jgi:hypothetical protein
MYRNLDTGGSVDFVQFVGREEEARPSRPGITKEGDLAFADSDGTAIQARWSALRVHRGGIQRQPTVAVSGPGSVAITLERVVWKADSISASGAPGIGMGTVGVTGSLGAGAIAEVAVGRFLSRKTNRQGALAGQVMGRWIHYVGCYDVDNFLRLGVADEARGEVTPVYIDLVFTPECPASVAARRLLETLHDERLRDVALPERIRAQHFAHELPAAPAGKLTSTTVPGWTTTSETRAERYSARRHAILLPRMGPEPAGGDGESIWTGAAAIWTAEAKAARGREVFSTVMPQLHNAAVRVTADRLRYEVPYVDDLKWLQGPPPGEQAGLGTHVVGEVMHRNVANVIRADDSPGRFPGTVAVRATVLARPTTVWHVHLVVGAGEVEAFVLAWVRAVAAWRLASLPVEAPGEAEKRQRLVQQAGEPSSATSPWGAMFVLPLSDPLDA